MGFVQTESSLHWNYFLALEQDLEKIARYIEFHSDNYETYSIELAHLLLAASSEVDVVMKQLVKALTGRTCETMKEYQKDIKEHFPHLLDVKCSMPKFSIDVIHPWLNWMGDEPKRPDWWYAYNKIKHDRNNHYPKANLKNVINALAALYITSFYLDFITANKNHLDEALFSVDAIKGKINKETQIIKFNTIWGVDG